jgi:hypothetical protein
MRLAQEDDASDGPLRSEETTVARRGMVYENVIESEKRLYFSNKG